MIKYRLNGSWQIRNVKDSNWVEATVPGSVLSTLIKNNKIDDPYYRENEYAIRELFREDYEFFRCFQVSEELLKQTM